MEWLSISTIARRGASRFAHAVQPFACSARLGEHLFIAGQGGHRLPGRQEVEAAEILGQHHRFVDDLLAVLVVADLDIAGQREILAQRMTLEAVIGQDAAQVRLAVEDDAEQVPRLALPPRRGRPDCAYRRHRRSGIGGDNDPDALVQRHRQQIVDDIESFRRDRASRRRRCPSPARRRIAGSSRSAVITAISESRAASATSSSCSIRKPVTPGIEATACPSSSSARRRRSGFRRGRFVSHEGSSPCGGFSSATA